MTKTHIPDKNSWVGFLTRVKEALHDYEMSEKDYSKAMQFYISGKSSEEFIEYLKENNYVR